MITNCGLGIHTDAALPDRRENDWYPTDAGTVARVVRDYALFRCFTAERAWPREVLDPGAGSGVWGREVLRRYPSTYLAGIELREEPKPEGFADWVVADYLELAPKLHDRFDLIIGNPPYRQAEAFVRESLRLLRNGGHLVFLLRMAFLEGMKRRGGLFREFPPREVWVNSRRPSFTPDGKTNATAFATFVWEGDWGGGDGTRLRWIGD